MNKFLLKVLQVDDLFFNPAQEFEFSSDEIVGIKEISSDVCQVNVLETDGNVLKCKVQAQPAFFEKFGLQIEEILEEAPRRRSFNRKKSTKTL